MDSLPNPLSVRYKPFYEKFFAETFVIYDIEFERIHMIFNFSTVITLEINILQCGREFWMKVSRLKIFSSTKQEDLFTQLFVTTCKIIVSAQYCNKRLRCKL